MKNPYEALFMLSTEVDPTDRLCSLVMQRIERREVVKIRFQAATFGLLSAAAIIGLIPAVDFLSVSFGQSGVAQYISLFMSDSSYVMSHWQDALMSILDSLPIVSMTIIIALSMICLESLRRFSRYLTSLSSLTYHLS